MEVAPDTFVRYRTALEEIASEDCTYFACEVGDCKHDPEVERDCPQCGDDVQQHFDPGCPGEVCTARRALAGADIEQEKALSQEGAGV